MVVIIDLSRFASETQTLRDCAGAVFSVPDFSTALSLGAHVTGNFVTYRRDLQDSRPARRKIALAPARPRALQAVLDA
jgi:hypothetical protein